MSILHHVLMAAVKFAVILSTWFYYLFIYLLFICA
jgi:hypothetical protein